LPQKRDAADMAPTRPAGTLRTMSYTVTLGCGCRVYVSCHPRTGLAHTRIIEQHSPLCAVRSHAVGVRVPLWELLPYEPDETTGKRPTRRIPRAYEHAEP